MSRTIKLKEIKLRKGEKEFSILGVPFEIQKKVDKRGSFYHHYWVLRAKKHARLRWVREIVNSVQSVAFPTTKTFMIERVNYAIKQVDFNK